MLLDIKKEVGVELLDPSEILCNIELCKNSINGTPIYFDDDHLNSIGTEKIHPIFDELWE
jgi:hypothetical protein